VNDYVKNAVVVHAGRVLVTLPKQVFALDTETGNPIWRFQSERALYGAPVRTGNQLWLLHSGDLIGLDAASGERIAQTPIATVTTNAGLTGDGRELYVGFFDGELKSFAGATP
jgi:outer membrane protein assembly factor BamB